MQGDGDRNPIDSEVIAQPVAGVDIEMKLVGMLVEKSANGFTGFPGDGEHGVVGFFKHG